MTTAARAQAALPAANLSADPRLSAQILAISQQVLGYLRIPSTLDGRVTLGVERVVEKLDVRRGVESFYLGRGPVLLDALGVPMIHMIVVDDEVLTINDIELLDADGLVGFVEDGDPYAVSGEIIIEYTAGYQMPWVTPVVAGAPPLPSPIEEAMFCLLKGMASSERANPSIRSESSDEVDSFTYFAEGATNVSWREAYTYLDPYRRLFQ